MSRLKKLNKLNKTKTLSVAMSVGLVAANLVNAVPVMAVAPVSAHAMSTRTTIDPAKTQTFDKKDPQDISATVTVSNEEYQLQAVKNGSKTLEEGTDYTFDGSEITISQDYLMNLKVGTASLKLDFDKGSDPIMRISVKDSRATAKLSTKTVDAKHLRNITATLTLHDDTFAGIEGLQEDSDYTVRGSRVTISKDYLATLADGENTLVFNFDESPAVELTFNVKNSEVAPSAKLQSVSAENGTLTATFDQDLTDTPSAADFTVKKDGVAVALTDADVTVNGDKASIKVDEVAATDADQSIVYSVTYKGVTKNATLVVPAKTDNTAPVITLTGDATVNVANGATYTELGATATDDVDATVNVTSVIKNSDGTVVSAIDTTVAGTYTITYSAKDAAGNAAADKTRTVIVQPALVVSSVSAVTKTSLTVTLATGTDMTAANVASASSYSVKVNDEAAFVPTTATVVSTTSRTVRLDWDNANTLNNKQGNISVNGVAATVDPAYSYAFDFQKPTIVKTEATDNKTMIVTFSEPVADTALTTTAAAAKYSLYQDATQKTYTLGTDGAVAGNIQVEATFNDAAKTQVKLTIKDIENLTDAPRFINEGLKNEKYILLVSNVADRSAAANSIVASSPYEFQGTMTPSVDVANALSATYNAESGQVALTFNKVMAAAAAADNQVYFTNGTTKVYLKAAEDFTGIAGTSTLTFTVKKTDPSTIDAIKALGSTYNIVVEAGAFKDSSANDCAYATITPTIVTAPTLQSVAYDDINGQLTLKFSSVMDMASMVTALANDRFGLQTGVSTFTSIGGSLATAVDSDTVVINVDDATARIIEKDSVTAPKFRLSQGDADVNVPDTTEIADVKVATLGTKAISKDYTGIFTKTATAEQLVSASYDEATNKLKLTFNKKMVDVAAGVDSTKVKLWVNGISVGTIDNAGVKINADEAALDGSKTLTFTLNAGGTGATPTSIETDPVKAGLYKVQLSIASGAIMDRTETPLVISEASKVDVTYTGTAQTTAPTTVAPQKDGKDYIIAKFNNPVSKATAENVNNYKVYFKGDNGTTTFTVSEANMLSDYETVYLKVATPMILTEANYTLGVQNIASKDDATKVISSKYAYTDSTALAGGSETVAAPKLATATGLADAASDTYLVDNGTVGLSSGDTFVISYNKPVEVTGPVSGADGVVFDTADSKVFGTGNITVTPGTFKNQLVVTLGAGENIVPGTTNFDMQAGQTVITALDGTTGATASSGDYTLQAPLGKQAPIVSAAQFTDVNNDGKVDASDKLVLTFDQDINASDAIGSDVTLAAADLIATTDGATYTGNWTIGTPTSIKKSGTNEVTVTIGTNANLSAIAGGTYFNSAAKIQIKDTGAANIKNNWGIAADSGANAGEASGKAVTPTIANYDSVGAKIVSATIFDGNNDASIDAGDVLIVKFDKSVDSNANLADAHFAGTAMGSGAAFAQRVQLSPNTLMLTIGTVGDINVGKTLDIRAFGSNGVLTVAGVNAISNGGTVAIAAGSPVVIDGVGTGTGATAVMTKVAGVQVKGEAATNGIITADEDALMVNSYIRAYKSADGTALGALDNIAVTDTDGNAKSDAIAAQAAGAGATFEDLAKKNTVVFVTKSGDVKVVNVDLDLVP